MYSFLNLSRAETSLCGTTRARNFDFDFCRDDECEE